MIPGSPTLLPCNHADQAMDALQTTFSPGAQSLENFRLAERIECALRATGYGSLRGVTVSVSARVVILLGQVPSYYLKQLAQATVLAVPGAYQIHNGLDVARPISKEIGGVARPF